MTVPFGQMEKQRKLTREQLEEVLEENRRRYSATGEVAKGAGVPESETLIRPDLL